MPLSISHRLSVTASTLSQDPREAAKLARQAGFRGLVFDCYGAIDLTELSITGRRDWLRSLPQNDLALTGLQMDLGRGGLGPGADVERQVSRTRRAMETAAALQAGVLCVELGLLPRAQTRAAKPKPISAELAGAIIIPQLSAPPQPVVEPSPPSDPTFVAQVQSVLAEVGGLADRIGVRLAFSSALSSLQSLQAAVVPLDCPWFGFDLDPAALLRDGLTIDDAFSLVGGALNHVRLRDAIAGDDNRTRPVVIGSGNVKWAEFLGALEAAGYAGALTIDPAELINRSAAAISGRTRLLQTAEAM